MICSQCQVRVGGSETPNQFYPNQITANAGDMITFMFLNPESSINQTSVNAPCTQIAKGKHSIHIYRWVGKVNAIIQDTATRPTPPPPA